MMPCQPKKEEIIYKKQQVVIQKSLDKIHYLCEILIDIIAVILRSKTCHQSGKLHQLPLHFNYASSTYHYEFVKFYTSGYEGM